MGDFMNALTSSELPAADAALLDVGLILGQNHAFGVLAGRCSAAVADGLLRLRQQKLYKRCTEKWDDFCPQYLKISRVEADRTIKLLEEFGPAYFDLSQITRVSPETFRAIAPHIRDGALHYNGEVIEMNLENSRRIAAAVSEMRNSIPKKTSELVALEQQLTDFGHELGLQERIGRLANCCFTIVAEFEKISRDERLGPTRVFFQNTLATLRDEMARVARENGR